MKLGLPALPAFAELTSEIIRFSYGPTFPKIKPEILITIVKILAS
jgi:hypothetical protein